MSTKNGPLGAMDASLRGKVHLLGISWYEAADYAAARAIMTDDVLPATFAEWLQKASGGERSMQEQGFRTIRAVIDPRTFPGWCARNGFAKIDAKARTAFAAEYAARQVRS
jgi:hypothetical protein